MSDAPNTNLSAAAGGLFFLAGVAFGIAGILGPQPAFYGIAAICFGVGVVFIAQAKKEK